MEEKVSLKSLMTPSKTVEVSFPGHPDFKVQLCFLARESLVKLRKKCQNVKFNKKTRQPEEILDEDLFISNYCKEVIKDWTGLKYRILEELLLVDVSQCDPEGELPYSEENAELLMKNSVDFDTWVTEVVSDLENFTKRK